MADSLVIAGQIELIGAAGGIASTIPDCAGAVFLLGDGYDMGAPQPVVDLLASSLLDGERPIGRRSSNRTITLPVNIWHSDRAVLAAAREVLLALIDADEWQLVWTRDGGLPVVFDCFRAFPAQPANQLFEEQAGVARLQVSFPALPYGRSDTAETLVFNAPAQNFDTPIGSVTVDDFNSATTSFLLGDASGFEGGIANWVSAGNCAVAQTSAQAHTGTKSLQLTASSAATMTAAHVTPALVADDPTSGATGLGLKVNPGDTVNVKAWFRTAVTARSVQVGAEFFDASGTSLGDGLFGSTVSDSSAAWTQATTGAGVTAPASAAYARVKARVQSPANAEVHYVDDATLDRGPVYSFDDSWQWSQSSQAATGSKSALWSRSAHDFPVYDHILTAQTDITGRSKFSFWFGLATTTSQYATWHKGMVTFSVVLTDSTGNTLSFGVKRPCKASGLPGKPHWQLISVHIPQKTTGFDYTTVSRYAVSAWNLWETRIKVGTGTIGQAVLQASAYFNLVQVTATSTGSALARGAWYTIPGPVGSAPAALALQAAPGPSSFSTVTEFTTPGSNAWTAPSGVTKVDKAEAWGGGGGGGGGNNAVAGGGGGGAGEYSKELNVPVTPLSSYPATVGAGGTGGSPGGPGNPGIPGGDSFWSGQTGPQVRANGGHAGWGSQNWGGGKGGGGSTNYVHYSGGNGRQSNINPDGGRGGGGGGSGGTTGDGNDATGRPGANQVTGGGPGGNGGNASVNPQTGSAPTTGPGGGGGGGAVNDQGSGKTGGNGANGKVRLTYGASGLLPLASLLLHTPGPDDPDLLNPYVPLVNTDVPNGATEYLVPNVGNLKALFDGTYTMFLINSTWNSPASSRNLTVQMRQYPYSGGTAFTQNVVRNGVTPNTDIVNGFVDMGAITLPLNALPPGNSDGYFAVTITSSNTADRFNDVLLISTTGNTLLVNISIASIYNNIWVDEPDHNRALGSVLGSDADRDRAFSLAQYIQRLSGGPLSIDPQTLNRILVYSAQGAPAITATYLPRWMLDRVI